MKYRLLGNSGLRVSEAALGTMTFGDDWGWGVAKGEASKVYDAFREAGGNFIDTANSYTNASPFSSIFETFTPGLPKCGVLVALKASKRN
jgi:aryl-alcohol dehydrogenase-like predicted oxidoreductase